MDDSIASRLVAELECRPRQFDVDRDPSEAPVLVYRGEDQAKSLESLLDAPQRSRGNLMAASVDSLCALILAHDPRANARVYYTRAGLMRGVLNDDNAACAGWRDWTVDYMPVASESWVAWQKINGKFLLQIEMAEFIEERIADFVKPVGAEMLELAQQFEIQRSGKFVSGQRLLSGEVNFTFEEENKARGNVKVPTSVDLGMRVFEDLDAYKFRAMFRYRVGPDQRLVLAFKIENTQKVMDKAVSDVVERVRKALGSRPMLAMAELPKATAHISI